MALPGRDCAPTQAPTPPGLEVTYIVGGPERQRYTYMVGAELAPDADVYSFNSTIVNLRKGVTERVFYVKNDQGEFVSPPRPGSNPCFPVTRKIARDNRGEGCPICYEDYKFAEMAAKLPCGHMFHERCIGTWVASLQDQHLPGTCPCCRDAVGRHFLTDVDETVDVYTQKLDHLQKRILELSIGFCPLERDLFHEEYTGKKRETYRRAEESLRTKEISRKDGYTSNFTKTERTVKLGAVPRNISPRDPRYNVEVGVYIKPAEGILLDAVTKMLGSKTVMKGMNASQVGAHFSRKWERFGGDGHTVAVGLDASRFDQHVSAMALRWEHKFYLGLCKGASERKRLARLLEWQIFNKGFGRCNDGTLSYEIEGTRCSGDMNTGLGNCLIATCLLVAYCEEREIPFELANNGDDCVIFTHKKYLADFSLGLDKWFRQMGFNMVVEEPVYELEKVVFCQSQPVFDGHSWTMVRDPRSCIKKDCVSLKPWRNEKEYNAWLASVGMSGTSLAGGMPVLDAFYRSFLRASRNAKPLNQADPSLQGGLYWQSKGMHRRGLPVSDAARYSFWRAFDIMPAEQEAIEYEYSINTPYYSPVDYSPESLPVHRHNLLL